MVDVNPIFNSYSVFLLCPLALPSLGFSIAFIRLISLLLINESSFVLPLWVLKTDSFKCQFSLRFGRDADSLRFRRDIIQSEVS